eukprot:5907026-Prymnesium_polylepis.1
MDCLHALDVQLSHAGYSQYKPLGKLLEKLGSGFELEYVFRHALRGQMLQAFDKMLDRHS